MIINPTTTLNKDLNPSKIYLNNPNLFKDPQQISNLKHILSVDCPFKNKSKKMNIVDESPLYKYCMCHGPCSCSHITNNVAESANI